MSFRTVLVDVGSDVCVFADSGGLQCVRRDHHPWPTSLRLGCQHPAAIELTAFGDPARYFWCNACRADWSVRYD